MYLLPFLCRDSAEFFFFPKNKIIYIFPKKTYVLVYHKGLIIWLKHVTFHFYVEILHNPHQFPKKFCIF